MNRREFLDARRNIDKSLTGSRLILTIGISATVLLALRYTPPMKTVERQHWTIIVVEMAFVLAGFRYVDRIRSHELRKSHGMRCPACSNTLLKDGGIPTLLTCDCPHCGARVFDSDQPIGIMPISNRTVSTRSQFILIQSGSEQLGDPMAVIGFSYMLIGLMLSLFVGHIRFPGHPEVAVLSTICVMITVYLLYFTKKHLERLLKPRGNYPPVDCPKCRRGCYLRLTRSLAGPDGRCRKCKVVLFVEDLPDRSIWNDVGLKLRTCEDILQAKKMCLDKTRKPQCVLGFWVGLFFAGAGFANSIAGTTLEPILSNRLAEVICVLGWLIGFVVTGIWFASTDEEARTELGLKCPACKLRFNFSDYWKTWPWLGELLDSGCCPGCKTPLVSDFEGKRKSVPYAEAPLGEGITRSPANSANG
jgi:hypothetical protein